MWQPTDLGSGYRLFFNVQRGAVGEGGGVVDYTVKRPWAHRKKAHGSHPHTGGAPGRHETPPPREAPLGLRGARARIHAGRQFVHPTLFKPSNSPRHYCWRHIAW